MTKATHSDATRSGGSAQRNRHTTMSLHVKRYFRALRARRQWALLVPLACALYLLVAALTDVTFRVSQDFSFYSGDIPVAAANSPVATLRLRELTANPDLLFLDSFALMQLEKQREILEHYGDLADENAMRRLAYSALSLSTVGSAGLRLSYTGKDSRLGSVLVPFYADRLMKRIADGRARTRPGVAPPTPGFQTVGDLVLVGTRSAWSAERLLPALVVLFLSSFGVLLLIAIFELSDPSFRSERQMTRYLGLPVLGTLPDAGPLLGTLPPPREPPPTPRPPTAQPPLSGQRAVPNPQAGDDE